MHFVALEGFEPSQAEPESYVLPLHHKAINVRCSFTATKVGIFFISANFFGIYFLYIFQYRQKKFREISTNAIIAPPDFVNVSPKIRR